MQEKLPLVGSFHLPMADLIPYHPKHPAKEEERRAAVVMNLVVR